MALCYRDRQYCSAPCANTACSRNLTDEVKTGARLWWGDLPGEAPISMADMSEGCESFQPVEPLAA